jgi:uncharacterized protein YjdB
MTRKSALTFLSFFFICTVFGGNVIGNGDFELTTTPSVSCWTTIGTQTYSIETLSPLSGMYSAKVVTGTAGTITSQGLYHMVCFPKASQYTVSFKAMASAPCAIQNSLVQSFSSYKTLVNSPVFNIETTPRTFSYTLSATAMSGLCKFAFYYGNVATGTTLWLDSVVVKEAAPLTDLNLCNGDFETTMNNAMYTPTAYQYNFRTSGTSSTVQNQYYYGWTKVKLATVTDTAAIVFDNSVNKISGNQSLKYTMVTNGVVKATKSSDHQLAWVFAGVRNSNYTISFKAKSSVNTNIGVAISNWGIVNYLPEKTVALSTQTKSFAFSTATVINQTDNRTILSFLMGLLPADVSVWIDDVTLVQGAPVSGVSLSATAVTINRNSTLQLKATVLPIDAALKTVIWTSSNDAIATVDANGVVTGIAAGNAIITATTLEGEHASSANISVSSFTDVKVYPSLIPNTTEVVNPGRGFYRWQWQELIKVPSIDWYERYDWAVLESATETGKYDFNFINVLANNAKNDTDGKGKCGFGIRCVVEKTDLAYPSYLNKNMNSWYSTARKCSVPDWNSPYFLERHDSLIANLGRQFNNDERIGYIEIRTYGNWGEWHLTGFETPVLPLMNIQQASVYRIIDAYVKAFPNKQLIMMSDHAVGIEYALSIKGLKYPIGWRRDSWCNTQFRTINSYNSLELNNRWQTAPVIIESYNEAGVTPKLGMQQIIDYHVSAVGNGNFGNPLTMTNGAKDSILQSARISGFRNILRSISYSPVFTPGQSVRVNAEWSNVGVAPTYDNWMINYRLFDKVKNDTIKQWTSKLDLKTLLPTYSFSTQIDVPLIVCDTLDIPSTLPAGNYDLEVLISDADKYFLPLKLANDGRNANGAYVIGAVTVSGSTALHQLQSSDSFSVLRVSSSQVQLDIHQSGVYTIEIFTVEGQNLLSKSNLKFDQGIHSIDMKLPLKGIYIVKVMTDNQQKVVRFVAN